MVAAKSKAETDKEQLHVQEATIYEDLHDLEETIIQSINQTSLTDTFSANLEELHLSTL